LESGQPIIDGFDRSGRKGVETKLPKEIYQYYGMVQLEQAK
jgi:hypothetical protein